MVELLNCLINIIYFGLLIASFDCNIINNILYISYIITTIIKI